MLNEWLCEHRFVLPLANFPRTCAAHDSIIWKFNTTRKFSQWVSNSGVIVSAALDDLFIHQISCHSACDDIQCSYPGPSHKAYVCLLDTLADCIARLESMYWCLWWQIFCGSLVDISLVMVFSCSAMLVYYCVTYKCCTITVSWPMHDDKSVKSLPPPSDCSTQNLSYQLWPGMTNQFMITLTGPWSWASTLIFVACCSRSVCGALHLHLLCSHNGIQLAGFCLNVTTVSYLSPSESDHADLSRSVNFVDMVGSDPPLINRYHLMLDWMAQVCAL